MFVNFNFITLNFKVYFTIFYFLCIICSNEDERCSKLVGKNKDFIIEYHNLSGEDLQLPKISFYNFLHLPLLFNAISKRLFH